MALRAAFNWDHLAGVNLTPGNTTGGLAFSTSQWLETSPVSTPSYIYLATNTAGQLTIDSNGWLQLANAGGNAMPALEIPAASVVDTTKNASWVGFRYKAGGIILNSSSYALLGYATSTNGVGYTRWLTTDQLFNWGCVLGKEYFFEIQFVKNPQNTANYNINVWMDGVLKNTITNAISVASMASASTYLWFGPAVTSTGSTTATMSYRDMYFLDEDGLGNWDSARLGPIRTTPMPISAVSAPNYSVGTASLFGSAALSTAQSKFGGSSLFSTDNNGGATIQDAAALKLTGDFTIEYFLYALAITGQNVIYMKGPNASRIQIYSSQLYIYTDQTAVGSPLITAPAGKLIVNQMQHHALVKQGNTWSLYIDGQQVATTTASGHTLGNNTNTAYLGNFSGLGYSMNGYLDEFRISNVARYSGASFAVPTAQFTPDANTVMLLHCDQQSSGFLRDEAPTPQSVLSALQPNGVPATFPNLTNAATLDPLTVSFDSSAIGAGSKILAVKYQNAVLNQQAGNGVLNAALVQGANTTPLNQETFTDASMRYSRSLGIISKAPDGTALTKANIAATQLVLTPTS
jgi:hypothetical protein